MMSHDMRSCRHCAAEEGDLQERAENMLSYWEQHGDNAKAVSKWAVSDMLEILRMIVKE